MCSWSIQREGGHPHGHPRVGGGCCRRTRAGEKEEREGVRERRRILGSKAVLSYRAFQYMARAFEVAGVRVLEGKRRHPPSWWK